VVNPNRVAIDFWVGRPDAHSFPLKAWRRLLNRTLVTAGSRFTEYRDPAGLMELRRAIAEHLGLARGIAARSEQVIIVAGCQGGLNVAARLLARENARIALENPCYQGAAFLFESYRARLVPVTVDEGGLDVDALPAADVQLLYVTPSHQYPMGYTLSLERRLRLLDWARHSGAYIVEDDYDSDFRYRGSPLTALMGLDRHGSVIYLGTFSKSMGAGLRLGYMVVPPQLIAPARTVKALLDNGHPWLDQAVMAEFLASGSYANHLRRIRQLYRERRDCLVEALQQHFGAVELSGQDSGMHVTWRLPQHLPDAAELQRVAEAQGVGIYSLQSGAAYDFEGCAYSRSAVMLGYSSLSERQIREGIRRVAAALERWPRRDTQPPGSAEEVSAVATTPG
jgi:GntR family transcriptional regulator/MocR family aminotransferase